MAEKTEKSHGFNKKKEIMHYIFLVYCLNMLTYMVNTSRKIPEQNSPIYFCKGEV